MVGGGACGEPGGELSDADERGVEGHEAVVVGEGGALHWQCAAAFSFPNWKNDVGSESVRMHRAGGA